jgi:hypothetical protein
MDYYTEKCPEYRNEHLILKDEIDIKGILTARK